MKRILALFLSAALLLALLGGCGDSGAQGSADPSDNPTPTVEPTPADLEQFLWAIAEAYDFPGLDAEPPAEWVSQYYPGLADVPTEQCIVAMAIMSPPVCQIVLVQVTDNSDVQRVRDILDARIAYMIEHDSPYNTENWRNAHVEVEGNYIMMIAHAHCDDIVADFNAFIADPSFVPVAPPAPEGDDPGDNPGGGDSEGDNSGTGGGALMPVPGGNTEPDGGSEGDDSGTGGGALMPVPGGNTEPDGGSEGDDSGTGGGALMPVPGGDTEPDGDSEADPN